MKRLVLGVAALAAASALAAGWSEIGEVRVASQKTMAPQITSLANQAKFPLLPMLVKEGIGNCEYAQAFGALDEDAEIGCKLFSDGKKMSDVWYWPVKGGADAWRKANPGRKVGGGGKFTPAFTADGRHACVCEEAELAKLAAKKGVAAVKPLTKGLVVVKLDDQKFFDNLDAFAKAQAKELEKVTGQKAETPEFHDFLCEIGKTISSLRVVAGASTRGFDIRAKLVAREGASAAFREKTGMIASKVKDGEVEVLEFADGKAKDGKGSAELKAGLAKAIPESAETKDPLFAVRSKMAMSEDPKGPSASLWVFAWRAGDELRAIIRIPSADLAGMMAGMMQVQMQGQGEEEGAPK